MTIAGQLKQPNRPYFVAGDSRGWVTGNSTWNKFVFDTVLGGNSGGWYSPSTGLFTAPVAGLYLCTASLYNESNQISPAAYMHLTFGCNGNWDRGCGLGNPTDYTIFGSSSSGEGTYNASPTALRWAVMNKGDTMQLNGYLGGNSGRLMYGVHSQWGCALFAE